MKAVIISAQRCGGLFLAGCLSNHPDIHCLREEPFRGESIWQQKLNLDHADLLDFVLSEPYYPVSMCRLTYDQAFHPDIQDYLLAQRVRIVHLQREEMAVVTSTLLAKQEMTLGLPRHHFDDNFDDDEVLAVKPDQVVRRIKHLRRQRRIFYDRYVTLGWLAVEYERMVAPGGQRLDEGESARICAYLDVHYRAVLPAENRKLHKRPIESYYPNWKAVSAAVRAAFPDVAVPA